jgi:uncharacterized Ntn-hydrolase superfamily protein
LLTFGRDEFSRSDLRVDLSDEPIAELRRVYDFYAPLVPYYVERARNHKIGRYKDSPKAQWPRPNLRAEASGDPRAQSDRSTVGSLTPRLRT